MWKNKKKKTKKTPKRTGSDPKSVQKNAHYFEPQLRPREPKKAKYATFSTEFPEIWLLPILSVKKIVTFKAATRPHCRYLSSPPRHHETPIKQARKRWGIWTHAGDQIPLLKRQNVTKSPSFSAHIYIYIYLLYSLYSNHTRDSLVWGPLFFLAFFQHFVKNVTPLFPQNGTDFRFFKAHFPPSQIGHLWPKAFLSTPIVLQMNDLRFLGGTSIADFHTEKQLLFL